MKEDSRALFRLNITSFNSSTGYNNASYVSSKTILRLSNSFMLFTAADIN